MRRWLTDLSHALRLWLAYWLYEAADWVTPVR
jgi:hypothetical protein